MPPEEAAARLVCRRRGHTLDLPHLRLQTPTGPDIAIALAAGSDPEAQRWLGWPPEHVTPEHLREKVLTWRPGTGSPLDGPMPGGWSLVAVERESDLLAGVIEVDHYGRELGGWLAPRFRSRGLGGELFRGGAIFARHIGGGAVVRAGAEQTNVASIGALRSAGFVPAEGPAVHRLADGREVPARWFRHDAAPAERCRFVRSAELVCRRGRHTLDLPRLRLRTPTAEDLWITAAAGSDTEAQRWLGWHPEQLVRESDRERLLNARPGQGSPLRGPVDGRWVLVAVDRESDRIAGEIDVRADDGEIGGWLAPEFRSRRLGRELFAGAALFAHHVLGAAVVGAGTEAANAACVGALCAAGFAPTGGSDVHRLRDGRVITAQRFRHHFAPVTRCRSAG